MRGRTLAALAALAALTVLVSCTEHAEKPEPASTSTAEAQSAQGHAALVDPTVALPVSWSESAVADTGWTVEPQIVGEFVVGFADDDGVLVYSVIDSTGRVRWQAERPASCTGFAVATTQGRATVVLTDSDETGDRWQTTATSYDAATGEVLWGPVAVPGTAQGPGLVFGQSAPAATLGDVGPRIALNPATGEVVANEETDPDLRILGEFDGTVLLATGSTVIARASADSSQLWSVTLEGDLALRSMGQLPGGIVLQDAAGDGYLVGLSSGEVLADDVQAAAYEPLSRTWVWTDGSTVTGAGETHTEWVRSLDAAPEFAAVGMGLVYLRVGGAIQVLNAVTGADAIAYPQDAPSGYAVPVGITSSAAGLFHVRGRYLLALVEAPPG